jgi:S1-C subfamily serine protease
MIKQIVKIIIAVVLTCTVGTIANQYLNIRLFSLEGKVYQTLIQRDINHRIDIDELKQNQSLIFDAINFMVEQPTINLRHILRGSVIVFGLRGLGSGTVINVNQGETYILTCAHVIADVVEANLTEKSKVAYIPFVGYIQDDEKGYQIVDVRYGADIVKYDAVNDMALLKIYFIDSNFDVIGIANEAPKQGDTVYSVGNSMGVLRTLSKGILSNHKEGFYFSDNTTTFGNSGGGLYNENGELIGIPSNVMGYSFFGIPESSLGLSIDLYRIKEFLRGEL